MPAEGSSGLPTRACGTDPLHSRRTAHDRRSQEGRGTKLVPRPTSFCGRSICTRIALAGALTFVSALAHAQLPVGSSIVNVATVEFLGSGGLPREAESNPVEVVTVVERTPASVELLRLTSGGVTESVGPTQCVVGTGSTALPAPVTADGRTLDSAAAQPLAPSTLFHAGESVFVRVTDPDQNLDPGVRETVSVAAASASTGDAERIELTETGADTGVFTGYVPTDGNGPAAAGDCRLGADRGATFTAEYADPADPTDRAAASARFDPVSRVFDALTGAPVDGVTLTLVDADSGRPAAIRGDDGVSTFPATITTGDTVTDSSGASYTLGTGEFRYPLVEPGDYTLEILPPTGYRAPSTRTEAELQGLDGGPFMLIAGSFGQRFTIDSAPFAALDVPVDPSGGDLYLSLAASTAVAAPGDIVEFHMAVTHSGGLIPLDDVVIRNPLPPGLRYADASARLAATGQRLEPQIGADGRTLEFAVGSLDDDETIEIVYVAHVVPAGRQTSLSNRAQAFARDTESNQASVGIELIDDFFTDSGFIAGRVRLGECAAAPGEDGDGFAGVRVYLEDGRFAVTDEGGRFHFEGLEPGTHVVQIDRDSIPPDFELVDCPQLASAGGAASRFVDLAPGQLKRADFAIARKPPVEGALTLSMRQTVLDDAAAGDAYELAIDVGTVDPIPTTDVGLMLLVAEPMTLEGAELADGTSLPAELDDGVVTVPLGSLDGPWSRTVRIRLRSRASADGELPTRALARFTFDGERHSTPVVETKVRITPRVQVGRNYVFNLQFETLSATLSAVDRAKLDEVVPELRGVSDLAIEAVGHSDSVPISPRSRAKFADNYALSAARARAVADYLGAELALDGDRIGFRGVGPDQPVASDATAEGRALNRRVELAVSGLANAAERTVAAVAADSDAVSVAVTARPESLPPMSPSAVPSDAVDVPRRPDAYDVVSLDPATTWLWPPADLSPSIPNTKVAIEHRAGDRVVLLLNGAPVDPLNFEGTDTAPSTDVVVSRWRGIDLEDGDNLLVATITGDDGSTRELTREIHFAGAPVRGTLLTEDSVLVADGKTRPLLVVRLEDRWGKPARAGATGRFEIDGPYRSWWEVERLRDGPLVATGDRLPTYKVGADGLAFIELEPTTTTGQVGLRLIYPDEPEQTFRAWVEPGDRDWILVGLAEGTLAYNRISGDLERSAAEGIDADYYDDGRLAFYAKGRVKGALLTAAFDSDGKARDRFDAFGGTIDPDSYYTIYGDATEQRFDAPSRERLYVKVERGAFLAMVGDFETGLTVTELSRYSRSMTGFRSERHGERVGYTAFAARTEQAFRRDEIRGDGTSGPYRLGATGILAGSDKAVIETRDRFRPDRIASTKTLRRHFDYDIDTVSGTIYLREPLPSRDFDFNPVYLVVDYESEGSSGGIVAGGRVAVGLGTDGSEAGVTLIDDGTAGAEGRLLGADVRYFVTPDLEIAAEVARSDSTSIAAGPAAGSAYLVELRHRTGTRQIEAYMRETDADFGLGQQRRSEPGTRRSGVALRNELGALWRIETDAFRQDNLVTDDSRTVVEAESRYEDPARSASFGLRRIDESVGGTPLVQNQSFVGGSWRFFDDLLTTRFSFEDTLTDAGESVEYPTRTLVGADVGVGDRVSLFGEHEIAAGVTEDVVMTRFGIRATPLQGTELDTSMQRTLTEYGPRNFANLGMRQSFTVGDHWALDLGGERATLLDPSGLSIDERVPPASGDPGGAFSSGYMGVAYRAPAWTFTSRLEHRASDQERRNGLIGSFFREQAEGRGFTAELRLLDRSAPDPSFSGALRLGWAYRPNDSRWTILNRADWIAESRTAGNASVRNRRLVDNLSIHYALSQRQELALKLSLKAVTTSFDAREYTGTANLLGTEWRRRLAPKYDFGLHATRYRGVGGVVRENGFGLDVGIALGPNFNLLVGYNVTGFDDADFARAQYTASGPFVQFRLKVDQASLRDLLRQ